jgi:hypothetical protein
MANQMRVATKLPPQTAFVVPPAAPKKSRFVSPLQKSIAIGMSKSHGDPHSTVRFVILANTGGFVFWTVMVCAQIEVLEHELTAP